MRSSLCAIALAVGLASGTAASAAPVLIDDFGLFQDVGAIGIPSFIPEASQVGPDAGILGGFRDMEVTSNAGGFVQTRAQVVDDRVGLSNTAGITGLLAITWDGDDSPNSVDVTGLGGVDLTGGGMNGALYLDVLSADLAGLELSVEIFDTSAMSSVFSGTFDAPIDDEILWTVLFSDLVGDADLTSTGAIVLTIGGPAALDASVTNFRSDAPPPASAVPLPAGLPLLIGGLAALGLLRRRRG